MRAPLLLWFLCAGLSLAQQRPRARDLGVPFDGTPGPLNALTDVSGLEVGHSTLIRGEGRTAVRTGVTAVWPRGKSSDDPAFGAWFSLNGNGEMTGTTWVEESGFVDGPVLITNTHSVGAVRDSYISWQVKKSRRPGTNSWPQGFFTLPIVAETFDGFLNDVNGLHVKEEHVFEALDGARSGAVPEGNVGGGTGMICFGFKGGIGTASRKLGAAQTGYTVAALVQCNCGGRRQLRVAGAPVGVEIADDLPRAGLTGWREEETGSIIIVIATDAPLLPHQLKRLARRATMGLARTGATSGNGSGDIFIAFSTANPRAARDGVAVNVSMLPNDRMNAVFEATVEAVEEAIVNAMVAAETMAGMDGRRV
ncbi:MAG: P1 family peptidase, partial [Bryobacteraceae bacterium]